VDIEVDICFSKFDQKNIFLLGKGNFWRKYYQTNFEVDSRKRYLSCYTCDLLQREEKNDPPIVSRAAIRDLTIINVPTEHNPRCQAEGKEKLLAEQMDRFQRRRIKTCSAPIKSLWRDVLFESFRNY